MSAVQSETNILRESGKASLWIGLGITSKLMVDLVIAASFGLGTQTDAFFVAFTFPLIIEALIYPACQSGLVPVFIREMHPEHEKQKRVLFSTLFNLGLLSSLILMVLGAIGAPFIVSLLAPGFDTSTSNLAVDLLRILLFSILIVGPVGVMRAYLNAHGIFTQPAMLELIRGVAVLTTILLSYQAIGIISIAYGYVVGGFLQFIFLAGTILLKLGFGYRVIIKVDSLKSSQVKRLFMVPLADYFLAQIILVAQRVIGSFLPPGSISAISYGHRLASVAGVILFSGVEVVSLSYLAADFMKGTAANLRQARETFVAGLRFVFILGIPVAISIWVLRLPLTQLVFERGAFDQHATQLAAPVIGLFALSIPFFGYRLLLNNYLFAMIQPGKVITMSIAMIGANMLLAILLWRFSGARGVALAFVGGLIVVYGLGFVVVEKELMPFQKEILQMVSRVVGASIAMGMALSLVSDLTTRWLSKVSYLPELAVRVGALALAGLFSASLLFGALILLQVKEATSLLKYLKRLLAVRANYFVE